MRKQADPEGIRTVILGIRTGPSPWPRQLPGGGAQTYG
jgi:hypothetical protein